MNAASLMVNEFAIVSPTTSVADAAAMMREHNTGCLIVAERGALAGIITERNMVLGCLVDGHTSWKCQVYRHMTLLTDAAHPTTDAGDALLTMMEHEISCLPVVAPNPDGSSAVVGILFAEDISQAIERDDEPITIMDGDLIPV